MRPNPDTTTGMGEWVIANALVLYATITNARWFQEIKGLSPEQYKSLVGVLADWVSFSSKASPLTKSNEELTKDVFELLSAPQCQVGNFLWKDEPYPDFGRRFRVHARLHGVYLHVGLATLTKASYDLEGPDFVKVLLETTSLEYNKIWTSDVDVSIERLPDIVMSRSKFSGLEIDGKDCCRTLSLKDQQPVTESSGEPFFTILYGPPGTGKTTEAKDRCSQYGLNYEVIQMHAGYSYEDFVEGIRPLTFSDGELRYDVVEGPLRISAHKASKDSPARLLANIRELDESTLLVELPIGLSKKYCFDVVKVSEDEKMAAAESVEVKGDCLRVSKKTVERTWKDLANQKGGYAKLYFLDSSWGGNHCLILDELNRANVSQVLGELIYALADVTSTVPRPVKFQYSGDSFAWPKELSLIATMNTADSSTERLDQAIKRRFELEPIGPNPAFFRSETQFLREYNSQMAIEFEHEDLPSLNDLFGFHGAGSTPEDILTKINSVLMENDGLNILSPSEKLIGHSYFIKMCRRLTCRKLILDNMKAAHFLDVVGQIFWHEITPALMSILNFDEAALNKFYARLAGSEVKGSLQSADYYFNLVCALFFKEKRSLILQSIDEFKKESRSKSLWFEKVS